MVQADPVPPPSHPDAPAPADAGGRRMAVPDGSFLLGGMIALFVGTYQVLVTQQVRRRLRGVPPLLAGSVAGIIVVFRVDPTEASMIFRWRRLGDGGWTVSFGAARGLLTYWVLQPERIVVLLDLTWAR
jgi:hypothetical protein